VDVIAIFIIVSFFSWREATATNLVLCYELKPALDQVIHHCAYCFSFGPVIDFNPHLLKSHERPHAYPTDNNCMSAALVKKVYRRLTPALNVRWILHHGYVTDFTVFHVYQSENLAVSEVPGPHGFKPAGMHGWNCYCLLHVMLSPV
jgi:hypothetical protein